MHRWVFIVLALFCLMGCASESGRLERRLEKNPSDAETLYKLGLAYRHEKRFLESARTLDRASALAPRHPYALNEAGVSYILADRPDLAVDRLEHQIRLNDDPLAHSSLGSVLSMAFDYDQAEAEVQKAIDGGLTNDGNVVLAQLRFLQFRSREARMALEAKRPNRVSSSLIGGESPQHIGGDNPALLDQLVALDEAAERVAGTSFTPPIVVPKSDLQTRAALMKLVGGRLCRVEVEGNAWKVTDVIVCNSDYKMEVPREGSGKYLVESIHEFHFQPATRTADEGKYYIRKFIPGQGRPPCWCSWDEECMK